MARPDRALGGRLMHPPPLSVSSGRQCGIALVLVMWVIALLAVMAVAAVSTSRTEVNLVRNRLDEARMRALAEAAVSMTVLRLRSSDEQDHWYPDGTPRDWQFAGHQVQVEIHNESSRLDLNAGPEQLLRDLISAAQVEEVSVDADALVKALLDWRDADQSARTQGAEDRDYRTSGLPYGAKDGGFDSTAELGQILGMPKELSRLLQPHVTVFTQQSQPMPEYASPLLRSVLQGEEFQQEHLREEVEDEFAGSVSTTENEQRSLGGPLYRIRVSGDGPAVEILMRARGGTELQIVARRFDWREAELPPGEGETAPPEVVE